MSGDFEGLRNACATRFHTGWKDGSGNDLTPIEWPNQEPFEPIADHSWVRFSVLSGPARRLNLGTPPVWRRTGQVIIQCFVPNGAGDGPAMALADKAANIFRDVSVQLNGGNIRFQAPTVREVGTSGLIWYQTNAVIPWQRDYVGD